MHLAVRLDLNVTAEGPAPLSEAGMALVNLGLGDAIKSVIAHHQRGIARGAPNLQTARHWHLCRE